MEIKVSKVDNGYILQVSKLDVLTGRPEVSTTIHPDIKSVIQVLEKL